MQQKRSMLQTLHQIDDINYIKCCQQSARCLQKTAPAEHPANNVIVYPELSIVDWRSSLPHLV
jgi:hypothetical protein